MLHLLVARGAAVKLKVKFSQLKIDVTVTIKSDAALQTIAEKVRETYEAGQVLKSSIESQEVPAQPTKPDAI